MKTSRLKELIKEELHLYFKDNQYSLEDELILENEILLEEFLNPDNSYDYNGSKGTYIYEDNNGDEFFVRLVYQPVGKNPYFELKTGWFDDNHKPVYEPSIPPYSPKSSGIYLQKRSNTVAKIFRDEIIPFFKNQNLSNIIAIRPISASRSRFSRMLINKFVPRDKSDVNADELIIRKK